MSQVALWLGVGLLLLWSLFPIVWTLSTSVKQRADIFAVPPRFFVSPNFDSYVKFLGSGRSSIWGNLSNSVIVAGVSTIIAVALGSMAAYGFSRYSFRGRGATLNGLLATRLLPPIVAVLPLFLAASSMGLVDTKTVLIVIYTALNIPLAVWLLKGFVDAVPMELEEACRIDGGNPLQVFFFVTLPLLAPGLASTALLLFILAWNEFMFAFLFTSSAARTLPLLLAEGRGEEQIFFQEIAALASLIMLPVLFAAIFLQKHLVRGLSAGALD